jgi:hypothetical protein
VVSDADDHRRIGLESCVLAFGEQGMKGSDRRGWPYRYVAKTASKE